MVSVMQHVGKWLLAKDFNAILVALVAMLLPLFVSTGLGSLVVSVVVALVTLSKGSRSGLILLVWLVLPTLALLWLGKIGIEDSLFIHCVLIWLLASVLRSQGSWRLIFEVAVVISILIIVVFHVLYPDLANRWREILSPALHAFLDETNIALSAHEISRVLDYWVPVASGLLASKSLLLVIAELMLARYWQSALFRPGAFYKEFLRIKTGRPLVYVLLLAIVLSLFKIAVIIDCLPVLVLPLVFSGLSVFHGWLSVTIKSALVLLFFYIIALFLMQFVILFLAIVGFVDVWVDFRRRFLTS